MQNTNKIFILTIDIKTGSNRNKNKGNVCHKVSTKSQPPMTQLETHTTTKMHLKKSLKSINEAEDILSVVNKNKWLLKSTSIKKT